MLPVSQPLHPMSSTCPSRTGIPLTEQIRAVEFILRLHPTAIPSVPGLRTNMQAALRSLNRLRDLELLVTREHDPDTDAVSELILDCIGHPENRPNGS